jgi:hypothetical protein
LRNLSQFCTIYAKAAQPPVSSPAFNYSTASNNTAVANISDGMQHPEESPQLSSTAFFSEAQWVSHLLIFGTNSDPVKPFHQWWMAKVIPGKIETSIATKWDFGNHFCPQEWLAHSTCYTHSATSRGVANAILRKKIKIPDDWGRIDCN